MRTAEMDESVLVIGAGQAGAQTVASLRQGGFGGQITLVGDEPTPPYQRPPLSKAFLAGTIAPDRLLQVSTPIWWWSA